MPSLDLYSPHYANLAERAQAAVRRATWDEDLGQASWLDAAELREWVRALAITPRDRVLEVACGSGGVACRIARDTGATVVGVDVNEHGVEAARRTAREAALGARASFRVADAARMLPFSDGSFDVVFCNDAINHLADRRAVLRDWARLLRPGGRLLFTDPIVVTGQLTGDEMRARSSIGFFLFTPLGHNERLLADAGFEVREMFDVSDAVVSVSDRWRRAREAHREALAAAEGREAFEGTQRFLDVVHTLASERRLSRYAYLATVR